MKFKAAYSYLTLAITFVGIITFFYILYTLWKMVGVSRLPIWTLWFGYLFLSLALLKLFVNLPYKIILLPNRSVRLFKLFKSLEIDSIERVYRVNQIPTFNYGTKGFFGFQGETMDGFKSYISSEKKIVALESGKHKYLISVTNIDEFINAFNSLNSSEE